MTEVNDMTHTNQGSLSLGQQLKQAREALNLTIEDVAKKTNLKKSHIESLENDIFILPNVAPTFVRGYVRNYTRFLHLPETLVSSVNYGEMSVPKDVTKVSTTNMTYKSQGQWIKYLTVFVLLCAAGMTLLWWWQDHRKEQENREHLVRTATKPVTNVAPVNAEARSEGAVPATMAAIPVAPEQTNADTEANVPESSPVDQESVSAQAENPSQQVASTENDIAEEESEQVADAGNDELRIEITGKESWITVKTANNKKSLVEKVYANGEVLTFNNNEEYRLTIGAPANVKIYYKGREVPLKIDGRVARIKLPVAQ